MRAILISTCYTATPPKQYGGIEYIVYILGKELAKKGIETWVLGSNESPDPSSLGASYNLVKVMPTGHSEHSMYDVMRDKVFDAGIVKLDNETVIIDHSHEKYMYVYKKLHPEKNIHIMSVVHDAMPFLSPPPIKYPCMCAISKLQLDNLTKQLGIHIELAYNGVEESMYPLYTGEKDKYILFISRITKEKAPHEAIYISRKTGIPLVIAGNDSPMFCEQTYVHSVISKCDGKQIKYLGEVSQEKKVELLQKAKLMLLPVMFPEPFGLVAIESMLCGTPVIALNNGAYKEIIPTGVCGAVCNDVNEMAEEAERIYENTPAPELVRKCTNNFTSEKMADRYIELMRQCIENPW